MISAKRPFLSGLRSHLFCYANSLMGKVMTFVRSIRLASSARKNGRPYSYKNTPEGKYHDHIPPFDYLRLLR